MSVDLPGDDALLTEPSFDTAWSTLSHHAEQLGIIDLTKGEYEHHLSGLAESAGLVRAKLLAHEFKDTADRTELKYLQKQRDRVVHKLDRVIADSKRAAEG